MSGVHVDETWKTTSFLEKRFANDDEALHRRERRRREIKSLR